MTDMKLEDVIIFIIIIFLIIMGGIIITGSSIDEERDDLADKECLENNFYKPIWNTHRVRKIGNVEYTDCRDIHYDEKTREIITRDVWIPIDFQ